MSGKAKEAVLGVFGLGELFRIFEEGCFLRAEFALIITITPKKSVYRVAYQPWPAQEQCSTLIDKHHNAMKIPLTIYIRYVAR